MDKYFDELLNHKQRDSRFECEEEVALRHPLFGNYEPSTVTSFYFTGNGGGIGPSTRQYDLFDCLMWLHSEKSNWIPKEIKIILIQGLNDWGVWPWDRGSRNGFESNETTGEFTLYLYELVDNHLFQLSSSARTDLITRIEFAKEILQLPETTDELVKSFYDRKNIEKWLNSKLNKRKKRKGSG